MSNSADPQHKKMQHGFNSTWSQMGLGDRLATFHQLPLCNRMRRQLIQYRGTLRVISGAIYAPCRHYADPPSRNSLKKIRAVGSSPMAIPPGGASVCRDAT